MSLTKIIEEIKQTLPFAHEDVEAGPVETLKGRRGRKNQAIERLKQLKREYRRSILDTAVFIIVTGDKREAYASIAKNFSCFSVDPDEFYKDLANRIPPTLYQSESLINLFEIIGRHLEDKALELDISEYSQIIFRQEYREVVKNKEALIELLKKAINQQIGSEIVGIQSVTSILEDAIKLGHGGKITPIILATNNEAFAIKLDEDLLRLRPRGVSVVVAGKCSKTLKAQIDSGTSSRFSLIKEVTGETVEKSLVSISNSIKK